MHFSDFIVAMAYRALVVVQRVRKLSPAVHHLFLQSLVKRHRPEVIHANDIRKVLEHKLEIGVLRGRLRDDKKQMLGTIDVVARGNSRDTRTFVIANFESAAMLREVYILRYNMPCQV